MGVYVDVDDIKQHFRSGAQLGDETIDELMSEQETYVMSRLALDSLPPDNLILKSIIRDLTISAGIHSMVAASEAQTAKAVFLRNEALRKIRELNDDRTALGETYSNRGSRWENEVINPNGDEPFFTPEDFGLTTGGYLSGFER